MIVREELIDLLRSEISKKASLSLNKSFEYMLSPQVTTDIITSIADMLDSDIDEIAISEGRQIRFLLDIDLATECPMSDNAIERMINQRVKKCERLRKYIQKDYPMEFDFRFVSGIITSREFWTYREIEFLYGFFIYKLTEAEDTNSHEFSEDHLKDFMIFSPKTLEYIYSHLSDLEPKKVPIEMTAGEKVRKPRPNKSPLKAHTKIDPMDEIMEDTDSAKKKISIDPELRAKLRTKMRRRYGFKI